jgi:hypothetical protein
MTIEVRQLLIRAVIDDDTAPPAGPRGGLGAAPAALPRAELERLRAQLLAECRQWLAEQWRAREER